MITKNIFIDAEIKNDILTIGRDKRYSPSYEKNVSITRESVDTNIDDSSSKIEL